MIVSAYRRSFRLLAAVGLCMAVVLAACSQGPLPPAAGLVKSNASPERDYRLSAGDKLKIVVFGEDQLSGENQVGAGGSVSMPLLGEVSAQGMSVDEFTASLSERLARGYVKNPKVSVQILNYRPFYLHGEVGHAGEFAYRSGLRLDDAVAMAGGYSYRADPAFIYLRREGDPGEREVAVDGSLAVMPGDNIRIPERFF